MNQTYFFLPSAAAAAANLLQSCLTLCDPRDSSPPGSPVPGILQARTLEWVAISFSNASKWKVKVKSLSRVQLLATPWTAAHEAPPSTGFSRQECWSGGATAFSLSLSRACLSLQHHTFILTSHLLRPPLKWHWTSPNSSNLLCSAFPPSICICFFSFFLECSFHSLLLD